jgi:hypothetical protein
MNSENIYSAETDKKEISHFIGLQPVDFHLTSEQFAIIQHHLPKRYCLIENKASSKRINMSSIKLGIDEVFFYLSYRICLLQNYRRITLKTRKKFKVE